MSLRRPPIGAAVALAVLVVAGGCATTSTPAGARRDNEHYAFWPPVPDEPRVQFLTSFRYSADVEAPASGLEQMVFGRARQVLPIGKPYGVAAWRGRIYVCDITNPGVVILDLERRETRIMGARGVEPMLQPTDIAVADDGMKYVADRKRGRIFVFDANDRFVLTYGKAYVPVGVDVRGDDLYVADFNTNAVVVLDRRTGEQRRVIGGPGGEPGRFVRPLGVEVDRAGNVYVTDAIRGRVQKFAPDGAFAWAKGELGDSPGNFVRPKHIAVDEDGVVFVVDAAFQNVQMFNADAELLMYFGSPGEHPGAMSLPAGIDVGPIDSDFYDDLVHPAFEAQRLVVVTNQFGLHKVAVYALGRLKPGRTVADIAPAAAAIATGQQVPGAVPAGPAAAPDEPAPPDAP